PLNAVVNWTSPVARSCHCAAPISAGLTYFTLVNPSPRSRSSATNCGAAQRLGLWPIRRVVVSGGGSPKACVGGHPSSPAVPARPRGGSRLVIIPWTPFGRFSGFKRKVRFGSGGRVRRGFFARQASTRLMRSFRWQAVHGPGRQMWLAGHVSGHGGQSRGPGG